MPIYEYQCQACGANTEIIQHFNDPPAQECPSCKANALQKLISAPNFQLKGSGWYVTDFRDKNKKDPSDKPSSETKTENKSSETKTETSTKTDTSPKDKE